MIYLTIKATMLIFATSINLYCWNKDKKEKNFNLFALQSFILGFGISVWIKFIIEFLTFCYA
jgi:hypothetical protein